MRPPTALTTSSFSSIGLPLRLMSHRPLSNFVMFRFKEIQLHAVSPRLQSGDCDYRLGAFNSGGRDPRPSRSALDKQRMLIEELGGLWLDADRNIR